MAKASAFEARDLEQQLKEGSNPDGVYSTYDGAHALPSFIRGILTNVGFSPWRFLLGVGAE